MIIEIKTAYPVEWGKEYYAVDKEKKQHRAPCTCCDNTGKVTIKGVQYDCPRCHGNWRDKEVVGEMTVYSVAKYRLSSVGVSEHGARLHFERVNPKGRAYSAFEIRQAYFDSMTSDGKEKLYDDYKSALDRVKMLNAAERERLEGAHADG